MCFGTTIVDLSPPGTNYQFLQTNLGSPTYNNVMECYWTFTTVPTQYLSIFVNNLDIQPVVDFVYIFNGTSTAGDLLWNMSGYNLISYPGTPLYSTVSALTVWFHTDVVNVATGLDAQVGWVLYNGALTLGPAALPYQLYTNMIVPYNSNSNTTWYITSPPGTKASICACYFYIAPFDFFKIYSGPAIDDAALMNGASFNGFPAVETQYTAAANTMTTWFFSNTTYTGYSGVSAMVGWVCTGSITVSTPADYPYVLMTNNGVAYENSMTCAWYFASPPGTVVAMVMTTFITERSGDYFYVYDGPSSAAALLNTGATSGFPILATYYSTGNALSAVFTSNGATVTSGVTANVPGFVCANGVTTFTSEALLYSNYGGTPYRNGANCIAEFTAPRNYIVVIAFVTFTTEAVNDVLAVFDGIGLGGALLGSFSGTGVPPPVQSVGTSLTTQFTSDGATTAAGFVANVTFLCKLHC